MKYFYYDHIKMKGWIIAIIVVGVVLLIGLGVLLYFLLRKSSTPDPTPDPTDMPTYDQQPNSSVCIYSKSATTMHIYLEYANFNGMSLEPPSSPWAIISGNGTITDPMSFYPESSPPSGATGPFYPPNDVGSATWQILTLEPGKWVTLGIPNYPKKQAWSIRPLKYNGTTPCSGGSGTCGMPTLIESGKDMVGDMSAVDGVNYLLKYTLSTAKGASTIDFKANPCRAIGLNPTGCRNPHVDGQFISGTTWQSSPCPAGTCNTTGITKTWCDTIHTGQCANSSTITGWDQTGGPSSCRDNNLFTTYCYSHDDATSSPTFAAPYKMRLVYADLV